MLGADLAVAALEPGSTQWTATDYWSAGFGFPARDVLQVSLLVLRWCVRGHKQPGPNAQRLRKGQPFAKGSQHANSPSRHAFDARCILIGFRCAVTAGLQDVTLVAVSRAGGSTQVALRRPLVRA